jgi:nicotinate-nucleotide pyrophosphorylase (carboxylating)
VEIEPPPMNELQEVVARALAEDRVREDVTTLSTVPAELEGRAMFVAKQDGVAAGLNVAEECFRQIDPRLRFTRLIEEGGTFKTGDRLAEVTGPVRGILQGERVALNFVQRLSGTATMTRAFVAATAGTAAQILDTRKTTPGLRDLEKYAVRCGGGTNHRRDLAAMAMVKDNHREAIARAGLTLADGIAAIRRECPGVQVEVEIDGLEELEPALSGEPDWILLDNMSLADMTEAVRRTAGRAALEASGGVTLDTVAAIAGTGVDYISVGALTHSARALDIGLDLSF